MMETLDFILFHGSSLTEKQIIGREHSIFILVIWSSWKTLVGTIQNFK